MRAIEYLQLDPLQIIARSGKPLAELLSDFKVFPQTIQNIRVREKKALKEIPAVAEAIASAERALDGNGRVVVRYSGTEKLARVMVATLPSTASRTCCAL